MSKLKPKILHVYFSHSASGYRPGWARFDILTEMFRRKGYEAWILGYKMKWSSLKQKLFGGIEIDKNSKVINLIIPHWLSTIDVFLNNLFLIGGFGWSILLALISNRIKPNTIILTDDTIGTNFYFLLIKKILQKKINIIIDYQDLTAQMHTCKSKNIFKKLISQTIDEVINPRLAKKLIVISKFGKDYLMQRSNVKDIYVIPAIAESKNLDNYSKEECRRLFNIPLNYKVIIWSGFIEGFTTKDVLFLIDAISLCKHKNEIMLVMIGGGIEYDRYYILNHAKRKGVNAMHLGYFDSNKAEYWLCLRSADIGIFMRPNALFSHFLNGAKVADYISVGLPVIVPCLKGQLDTLEYKAICYIPEDKYDLSKKIDLALEMDLEKYSLEMEELSRKIFNEVRKLFEDENFISFLLKS